MKKKIARGLIALSILAGFITLYLPQDSNQAHAPSDYKFKHLSLTDADLTSLTHSFIKSVFANSTFVTTELNPALIQHAEPTLIHATIVKKNQKKLYTAQDEGCIKTLQTLAQNWGVEKIDAIKIEFVKDREPLQNLSFYATDKEFYKLYRNHRVITELTPFILSETIQKATAYLAAHMKDNGQFDYIYKPDAGKVPKKYNFVRHAGTLYALLDAYQQQPDALLLEKIKTGITYLLQQSRACPADGTASCIVEKTKVKLGGNALALLALAKYTQITHDQTHMAIMQKLADAIVRMQETNGHFISDWDITTWQGTGFVSEYYPGEATLALVELYKVDANPLWLATARKATDYIALTRDKNLTAKKITHDHWMLIAINQLHRLDPKDHDLTHAKKIVLGIQQAQIHNSPILDYNGGYYNPPRSTPAAVRTEGLIAAYHLFTDTGELDFAKTILATIEKNLVFQLQTHVFPETTLDFQNFNSGLGGFQKSVTDSEIRIDYVQHNLSGLLGYLKIIE